MPLSSNQIAALRTLSGPTVANTIETFKVRPREAGNLSSEIRALFPDLGPVVGVRGDGPYPGGTPRCGGQASQHLRLVGLYPNHSGAADRRDARLGRAAGPGSLQEAGGWHIESKLLLAPQARTSDYAVRGAITEHE